MPVFMTKSFNPGLPDPPLHGKLLELFIVFRRHGFIPDYGIIDPDRGGQLYRNHWTGFSSYSGLPQLSDFRQCLNT